MQCQVISLTSTCVLTVNMCLTILVEQLMYCRLLRVEEKSCHVIVGLIGAEEPPYR